MATWEPDDIDDAFFLAREGAIAKVWSKELLANKLRWFHDHGYASVDLDASRWTSHSTLWDDIVAGFSFPDYFGRNINAFTDCMRDVAYGEYGYGWSGTETGLLIVFRNFDSFTALDARAAHQILDTISATAREAMLVGNRVMCLVQSNDPRLHFEPVGAVDFGWTREKFLNSSRGL